MKNKLTSGDEFLSRLLFHLTKMVEEPVISLEILKPGKWLVTTENRKYFMKKYASKEQLHKQWKLHEFLRDNGFDKVIPFLYSPFRFQSKIFAIMPYVQSASERFTFHTKKERRAALTLLAELYECTAEFSKRQKAIFPKFNQFARWTKRHQLFKGNMNELTNYFPADILKQYEDMGAWCLNKLWERSARTEETAIIHGDVASHNFLKADNGKLYIIDFDLAACGAPMYDYLQWANRILPLLDWNSTLLWEEGQLGDYRDDELFLLHLLYPTDIFRECRRFIQSNSAYKQGQYQTIYELAIGQYEKRAYFYYELKKEIEK